MFLLNVVDMSIFDVVVSKWGKESKEESLEESNKMVNGAD